MKGAVPQLQAGGFTVYAEESKQGNWIAEVAGQLRASGQIGSTIVIQTGTNGPVDVATFDQIMTFLPAAEVPQVVFLTVHADRGWIADNNALIYALPGKYPNVIVLWLGRVGERQRHPRHGRRRIHLKQELGETALRELRVRVDEFVPIFASRVARCSTGSLKNSRSVCFEFLLRLPNTNGRVFTVAYMRRPSTQSIRMFRLPGT